MSPKRSGTNAARASTKSLRKAAAPSANKQARFPIAPRDSRHPIPLVICAVLTVLYAVLSYTAVRTKSPTYDEPLHAVAGWVHLHEGDFRINFEDAPLWLYWAALPNGPDALKVDWDQQNWVQMPDDHNWQWPFTIDTLYKVPGNDAKAFVLRSRAMMVLLGASLCVVVAAWSWQLAGPVAAVIATTLVSLDPNLIGHGALVKADVPLALMMAAVFFACWRVGRVLTVTNGFVLALLVAAAVNVRFSAVLLGPILVVVFGLRVLSRQPWIVIGRTLTTRSMRGVAGATLLGVIAVITYLGIWACYGFRFNPSPDPAVQLNTGRHKYELVAARFQAQYSLAPPPQELEPLDPNTRFSDVVDSFSLQAASFVEALDELRRLLPAARLSPQARRQVEGFLQVASQEEMSAKLLGESARRFASNIPGPDHRPDNITEQLQKLTAQLHVGRYGLRGLEYQARLFGYWASVGDEAPDEFVGLLNVFLNNRLLPSAWVHGLLYLYARSLLRGSFLLGQVSYTGWWYYFPLAMLFKTPVATLFALLGAGLLGVGVLIRRVTRRQERTDRANWRDPAWTLACLLVPFTMYLFFSMAANVDIGLRYVLCLHPLMYVAAGALIGRGMMMRRPLIVGIQALLGVMLLIETLAAWPNYIAYFNFAAGGPRGGLTLLGDSNLDWGQDLPLLRKWQDEHPDVPLALAYFGIADEQGKMDSVPKYYGINFIDLPPGPPDANVTRDHVIAVSATNIQGAYSNAYTAYRQYEPIAILGGTIYLYDLRPK